ncbi:hypothetical protein GCM10007923_02960 [Shinella yambaruensis]|uniref:Uncharacterized protein n=1 Tax=Shinella yambaruensis TaxID=415996 RepID=A0ABQ5ZC85_9HYPH|nr:hypothetical protein GCM10007923_02960 [Shinella yambaruensis]
MQVDAEAAAVDLAGAQMHEMDGLFRQRRLLRGALEGAHGGCGIGKDGGDIGHTGLHFITPCIVFSVDGREPCHTGAASFVMAMTPLDEGV